MSAPDLAAELVRRVDEVDRTSPEDQFWRQADRQAALSLREKAEKARAVLAAWEKWEADIILDSECWRGELPVLGQAHLDALTPLQKQRSEVLALLAEEPRS